MNDIEKRISLWEKMVQEAPDDMAYFSLGSAYREAGQLEKSKDALLKSIELNNEMSRAYQIAGQVLIKLNDNEKAIEILQKGYIVAEEKGDVMPQRAMGSLLEKLGAQVPKIESKNKTNETKPKDDDPNTVIDRRTGRRQRKLDDPPMRGAVGEFIYNNFGQDTWNMWIGQGTKVINELKLDFSKDEDQQTYERYMLEWLQINLQEIHEQ